MTDAIRQTERNSLYTKVIKVKGVYIWLTEKSNLTATGRHLLYETTQSYLPPDTSERAPS